MRDLLAGVRLAVSTLTVLKLPPGRVDRMTARVAMATAPLVGLVLAAVAAVIAYFACTLWDSGLIVAVVVIAALAAMTGLLHLDGLADTADGLGAPVGRDRLAIMKDSDIGAFGVTAVVLVLLVQVIALGRCVDLGLTTLAVITAVTTARLTLTLGCVRGLPAARVDGLGATVAGTVAPIVAAVVVAVTAAALLAIAVVHDDGWHDAARVLWSVAAGVLAGSVCHVAAVRRIGGITGDVLGAGVEVSQAVVLLAMCIRP